MTWTITTWDDADWSAAATLNEFVGAVNERKLATGAGSPLAAVSVGDDVQAASFFYQFQNWVESMPASFIVSHDAGVPRAAGHYNGAATIDTYADLAAMFSAAGLAYADWRRYTTHPDDGGVVAYGKMEVGDIIGPWIFEDLQKILNVLVWAMRTQSTTGIVYYYGYGSSTPPDETTPASWAAARAAAEAAYAVSGVVSSGAYSQGSLSGGGVYEARLYHRELNVQGLLVWNDVVRDADWYVKTLALGTFDDYGDVVLEDVYSIYSQDEPATDATTIVSGTKLGDATVLPNTPWCDTPTAGNPTSRGWYDDAFRVVVRWNRVGGFTYQ